MFRLEYSQNGRVWLTWGQCGSLASLLDAKRRLSEQGFLVRCLNALGQNIL
jgi:hypothetical protein